MIPDKHSIVQAKRLLRSIILFHWGPQAEQAREMNIKKIAKLLASVKRAAYEHGYVEGYEESQTDNPTGE
jgi:hypothetical protein